LPDSIIGTHRGWRIWHPTATMFLAHGVLFGVWATQIPAFKERLGLEPLALSLILFMLGGGSVLAMAGSAWLIHRIGVVNLMRITATLLCGFGILIPLAPDVITLAIVVFLFGASGGSMDVAMNTHACDVERYAGRPYMSSFHGMWSLGGLAGAGAGALLMRAFSPAIEASMISVAMLALFLWGLRGLLPQQEPVGHASEKTRFTLAGPALILGIVSIFAFGGEGIVLDWAAVYMKQSLAAGSELALMGYAAFAGSMAIMRLAGDVIRHRFSARSLVCTGGLFAAFGLVIGPLSKDPAIMIAGCAIAGAGLANIVPVLFSLAGALPRPGVQIAAVSTMGFGGLLAVPPLLGIIGQHYGLGTIFYAGAVGALAITILALSGIDSSPASRAAADA